jgi:hypothetical protein
MANDFMIQMTQNDFDVELLGTSEDAALFGALRKGGNQTVSTPNGPWMSHVMGVWHFVAVTGGGNFLQTRQWHIPRYEMAREMEQRKQAFDQFVDRSSSPIAGEISGLHMRMANPNELAIHLPGGEILPVDPAFTHKLQSDIGLLEKARASVHERGGEFFIPDLKTAADHPIESSSQNLLIAIALEKLMVPKMEAGNFGIYSAYCTYRDFDASVEFPQSGILELVDTQLAYRPESISDDICAMFADVQKKLLSEPIWGKGVRMSADQAVPILAAGMAKLTRAQRTQFILMNGMHGAGLFLPLAAVLGLCSFDQYGDYMCQGMAPDSPQEQERRTETAYINLFGQLASN